MLVQEFEIKSITGTNEYECTEVERNNDEWLEVTDYEIGLQELGEVSEPSEDFNPGLVHNAPENIIYKQINHDDGDTQIIGYVLH